MKPRILVTRKLPDKLLEPLKDEFIVDMWSESEQPIPRHELLNRCKDVAGVLCMLTEKIDKEVFDAAGGSLKVVSTMSVGFDHIDVNEAKNRNIKIGYTPDVLNNTVADTTIMLMLMAGRNALPAYRSVKSGGWGTWSPYWMTGVDLSGAVIGIFGMGSIAETVVKRLSGFGCQILYHSRSRKSVLERKYKIIQKDLSELLRLSDFISVHAPLTPETREICNSKFFSQMKSTAIFINTSRGGLVNHDDLYNALNEGVIYAAGIDVTSPEPLPPNSPLLTLNNCVVMPHIGSASIATRDRMVNIAVENLMNGIFGIDMKAQVF